MAVLLALVTREIHASLLLSAFAGALLLRGGHPLSALPGAFVDLLSAHMIPALANQWNVCVLTFSLMMGGLVEILNRNGSMSALAHWVAGGTRSPRRAGVAAMGMGGVVFFDGLTSSMLVGRTLRPIADHAGLSREKLAFIVDSTSSPIASVALISTWIAFEISLVQQGLASLPEPLEGTPSAYGLLIASLPHRYYAYFMLLIVAWVVWLGRDFSAMRACRPVAAEPSEPATASRPDRRRILLGAVPIGFLVLAVFGGLFVDGGGLESELGASAAIAALGRARADLVLVVACAAASVVAMTLSAAFPAPRSRHREGVIEIYLDGMKQMFLPVTILVAAWTLGGVVRELGTAAWLVSALEGHIAVWLLPGAIFVLAGLISFSTGTSWGTITVLMPLAIPVAVALGQDGAGSVLVPAIGAVLAGSVFGDHCSPISDTTIVSAFASGCDAVAHVRTQLPYALGAAAIALLLGYLPAGAGIPPVVTLPAGALAAFALIRFGAEPAARPSE